MKTKRREFKTFVVNKKDSVGITGVGRIFGQ